MPFKDGSPDWDNVSRDTLEKVNHWSDLEVSDIPRLAVLTDSFDRFIGDGEDASVITAWNEGAPDIRQIDGEPCERAVDVIIEAIASDLSIEDMLGLPLAAPLKETADTAPSEMRVALDDIAERFESRHTPTAANDNKSQNDDILIKYMAAFGGPDAFMANDAIYGAIVDKIPGQIRIMEDGRALFVSRRSSKFITLPVKPKSLAATPFNLGDPTALPRRDWLFAKHYIRRYVTASVGPGGGGKTAHSISEALAMVTGCPLLDQDGPLTKPLRVWWINAEDPQDEIDRRFHAAAKHFHVSNNEIAGRLFTDSGRDQEFVIARQDGRDLKIVEPFICEMVSEIRRREIDVVIIDPFVSTHEAQENDNSAMQRVAAAWTKVADEANCCVELVHHVTKNQGEVTADSARGGGAFKDKVRSMRVINAMTKEEGDRAGVDNPRSFFRVDLGKTNMQASGTSQWRRFVSVPLMNGKGLIKTGDEIGVVEAWRWPASADAVSNVTPEQLHAIKRKIDGGDCRDSIQSSQWAGFKVAEALQMNMAIPAEKKEVRRMLDAWKQQGHFTIEQRPDYKGIERPCLVPVFHTSND